MPGPESHSLLVHHPHLAGAARTAVQYPTRTTISAQAYMQILSHRIRRSSEEGPIVGTLLGTRNEDNTEVEIKYAYMIPASANQNEVVLPVDYHVEMFSSIRKAFPDYVIVGWYSTFEELTGVSGLIHTFYSKEDGTFPYPPVHLTVNPTKTGVDLNAYVASPLYTSPETSVVGNFIFVPIEHSFKLEQGDRQVLNSRGVCKSVSNELPDVIGEVITGLNKLSETITRDANHVDDRSARELFKRLNKVPSLKSADGHNNAEIFENYVRDLSNVVKACNSVQKQSDFFVDLMSK